MTFDPLISFGILLYLVFGWFTVGADLYRLLCLVIRCGYRWWAVGICASIMILQFLLWPITRLWWFVIEYL